MFKKLLIVGVASVMLLSGWSFAAPPVQYKYHVDITSDITADLNSGFQNYTKKTTGISFQTCTPNCVPFSLGSFWQTAAFSVGTGSNCFPADMVKGAIHIHKARKNASAAKAVFWFKSLFNPSGYDSEDGVEVKYMLTLTGGWEGDFPPLPDNTATMTATAWKMETEGKGKHKNLSTACKGSNDTDGLTVQLVVENITFP